MADEIIGQKLRYMSQDKFETITEADDEFYAVSGSGIGFPSNKSEDLTLGASGTKYTAPANGYFAIAKGCSSGQHIYMATSGAIATQVWGAGGGYIQSYIPVLKGHAVIVEYTASGTTAFFRFVYAEGE